MKVIDVYKQYFEAEGVFSGVPRKGASVVLTATSGDGEISYEISVSFFPHRDETDFSISYDAFFTRGIYRAKGRRSKKREAELMKSLTETANALAAENGALIFWDKPLIEARFG